MRILVITTVILVTAFGFFLKYLTYSRRNDVIPDNVKDVYDEDEYKKNQAYKMDNLKFSIIVSIIGTVITLCILLFNIHHALYDFITRSTENFYLVSLFIFFIPLLFEGIIRMLMDIYDTFVIEKRYGFNKTTPATFIVDTIKTLIITIVVAGGLFMLFLFLYNKIGSWMFIVFFFVLIALQFFVAFISPLLIRIFYKLTPLEDGELKDRVLRLAEETGFRIKGIYSVDASKRSTKLNAFATGFGKTKTIGLFDTLIEKMTSDEIIAVLAHEIGHAKKRHILKRAPLSLLTTSVLLAAAYFIITLPETSQAFGFTDANIAFGLFIMVILISPLMVLLRVPANTLSRKHEYESDAFAKECAGKAPMESALKKLYQENLGNLTPHPFVVKIEYSHPPLSQRIAALED